jgi:hypothetical protein
MTTFFPFSPPQNGPFQFSPTLDGQLYNAVVTWNLFANRWYVNLYSTDGTLIFALPLLGSVASVPIENIAWAHGFAEVQTTQPHRFQLYATFNVFLSGISPVEYNGYTSIFVTGLDTFEYPLASFPGNATSFGAVDFPINICGGYFATSTLVYREAAQIFEVNP